MTQYSPTTTTSPPILINNLQKGCLRWPLLDVKSLPTISQKATNIGNFDDRPFFALSVLSEIIYGVIMGTPDSVKQETWKAMTTDFFSDIQHIMKKAGNEQ